MCGRFVLDYELSTLRRGGRPAKSGARGDRNGRHPPPV